MGKLVYWYSMTIILLSFGCIDKKEDDVSKKNNIENTKKEARHVVKYGKLIAELEPVINTIPWYELVNGDTVNHIDSSHDGFRVVIPSIFHCDVFNHQLPVVDVWGVEVEDEFYFLDSIKVNFDLGTIDIETLIDFIGQEMKIKTTSGEYSAEKLRLQAIGRDSINYFDCYLDSIKSDQQVKSLFQVFGDSVHLGLYSVNYKGIDSLNNDNNGAMGLGIHALVTK